MFSITIDTSNDAFAEDPVSEVVFLLRRVTVLVESGRDRGTVFDSNGNNVGEWELTS